MGWCSGTFTFDVAVGALLGEGLDEPVEDKIQWLIAEWESMDWDCQADSKYWDHPIVRKAFMELHPNWGLELDR